MSHLQTDIKTIQVSIWRSNGGDGKFVIYPVPAQENQTILDVVTWIQHNLEPGLSYRFACRVGMCGSCAMMVNGKPRWTCRTHVQKVIEGNSLRIEPLRNLPVIRDLACDMEVFFDKWDKAEGVFHPTVTRNDDMAAITASDSKRTVANEAIECINCAVCYAACDTVEASPEYLGPAGLNRAWSLLNDSRDDAWQTRLEAVSGSAGCHNCHSQQSCTRFCPNELNPARSIAGLKRLSIRSSLGLDNPENRS